MAGLAKRARRALSSESLAVCSTAFENCQGYAAGTIASGGEPRRPASHRTG
ncbi:hypothetical protein HYS49_02765 [Candidatus Woesearchaeota archaeon]|nr:hypothetical protein [Candidatus Woesearchaeota archaeon]